MARKRKGAAKNSSAAAKAASQQTPTSTTRPATTGGFGRRQAPSSSKNVSTVSMFRSAMLMACLGYFVQKHLFADRMYPFGSAVKMESRPKFAPVDPSNDSLQGKHGKLTKIYERYDNETNENLLLKGPETVVVNPKDGIIYVLTEEALLVSLTDLQSFDDNAKTTEGEKQVNVMTAKATKVVDLGMGRPLGGRFTSDGKTLYVADAMLGLLRIDHPHQYPKTKVEIAASQVMDEDDGKMTQILYANDVAIGPKSGKVYFTDCEYYCSAIDAVVSFGMHLVLVCFRF